MPPPILSGRLSVIPGTKLAILESGHIGAPDALIFVGGLMDGLGNVGYVYGLAEATGKLGWSFVHLQLTSCYSQFGFKTLETDAHDIGLVIEYLRKDWGKQKIVLMGHSTGCQDAMQYVTVNAGNRPRISAAILQAPVSDVELFEVEASEEARRWVATAQCMVSEGKGQEYLPLAASLSFGFDGPVAPESAIPYTAYRFASLFGRRGDDDYFSSTIEERDLKFAQSSVPLLLVLCDDDEAYPAFLKSYNAKEDLLQKWTIRSNGKVSLMSLVLKGANHTVDAPSAREQLYETVINFLKSL